jgi:putative methionine-R-sulfoxide reductase with GAF domain
MQSKDPFQFGKFDILLKSLVNIHEICSYSSINSLHTLCDTLLNSCSSLVGSDMASVMIYDETSRQLRIMASKGITASLAEQVRLSPGKGIAGMVMKLGEPLVVENPKTNPHYVDYFAMPEQQEPFICIPLKTRDNVLGVVNVHSRDLALLNDGYVKKMLLVLAGKAALAIESMDLFDTLNARNFEMVETLIRALDAKDHYTHDHAGRAKIKAEQISRALSFSEKMTTHVKYAALLHDIGKIGIPEHILLKPGKLTPEEFEQIKKHPEIGYKIILPVKFLSDVAKMVLYHQEWYNGKGYPYGVAGEKIPLGARIVSVLDSWDAMTSDRPYRKALDYATAVSEVKKGRGVQFDPRIVDIFLALEAKDKQGQIEGLIFK